MDAGDWISIFMAFIASISAAMTYIVYRSATDPEAIIYADVDRKRPSIVNLIIKNIGNQRGRYPLVSYSGVIYTCLD